MHHVSGLVATPRALAAVAGARGLGAPIPLCCGLVFLPVDEENIGGLAVSDPEAALPGFEHLTPAVLAVLAEPSVGHALAYIETDYLGVVGGQGAVVCAGGRAVVPPA